MKQILFKQLLIGQHFTVNGVQYKRVETFYEQCCTPEYNFVHAETGEKKGLMKPHATVEVANDEEVDN
jgi:hypothetical protein